MKIKYKVIAFITFLVLLQCNEPTQEPITKFKPVMMRRSEMEKISIIPPRELKNVGKIYTYKNYLFINESSVGVHITDITIPELPKNLGILLIPGNEDIAIKNNVVYADSGPDLIAISMENPLQPVIISRTKEIFSEKSPPDNGRIPDEYLKKNRPYETFIVSWQ
ncbi:MAG: hypothetical protein EAZ27_05170 [Cytophagales bacterium]|nr:MAG: hypothetical protein EAZ27_05170 [Cytophagales bacterium]